MSIKAKQSIEEYRGCTEKQSLFLKELVSTRQSVCLYGGAGGGGKSYSLRTACWWLLTQYALHGHPGQSVALACSTYKVLQQRHVGKLSEEFRAFGKIANSQIWGYCFQFKDENLGRILLRNMENPDQYRGTEVSAAFVDELTELPEFLGGEQTLATLLYPIRSPKNLPFLPFGAGSNPDGPGFAWVKRIWVDRNLAGYELKPQQVRYVPAKVTDNPKATPEMIANLLRLPERLRKARYEGSWDAPEGARFPQVARNTHTFKFKERFPKGVPAHYTVLLGVDWGVRAPFAALWIAIDPEGNAWVYRMEYETGLSAEMQAKRVQDRTLQNELVREVRMDPAMWHKESNLRSVADTWQDVLGGDDRFGSILPGYNRSRATALDTLERLINRENGFPDLWIEEECEPLFSELSTAVWDSRGMLSGKREDIDPRSPDHAITALYYALHNWYDVPKEAGYDTLGLAEPWDREKRIRQELLDELDDLRYGNGTGFPWN